MTRRLAVLLLVLVGALALPVPAFAATATVTIGATLSPKALTPCQLVTPRLSSTPSRAEARTL